LTLLLLFYHNVEIRTASRLTSFGDGPPIPEEKEEPSMVTITLHCPHCGSKALVRDGHAPNDKQKYRCRACERRSRENPTPNAYPEARRQEILHARPRTQ